jgi:hypothetical protein
MKKINASREIEGRFSLLRLKIRNTRIEIGIRPYLTRAVKNAGFAIFAVAGISVCVNIMLRGGIVYENVYTNVNVDGPKASLPEIRTSTDHPAIWWTSSDPMRVAVDPTTGVMTGINVGAAGICEQTTGRCIVVTVTPEQVGKKLK